MMKPVPSGALMAAAAGPAASAPSDERLEDPSEASEPPHAATLHTTPNRNVALKPPLRKLFDSTYNGVIARFLRYISRPSIPFSRLSITPLGVTGQGDPDSLTNTIAHATLETAVETLAKRLDSQFTQKNGGTAT